MKQGLIFLAVGTLLGFLLHGSLCKPPDIEQMIQTEYVTVYDTTEITHTHVVAKLETLYVDRIVADDVLIAEGETQYLAIGDTTFEEHGELNALYFFPPENYFDFTFTPYPQEVKVIKILPPEKRWYQRNGFYFGAGVLATAVTVYLVK